MAKNSLGDPLGTVNLSTMQIRFATNENEQQHLTACGYRPLQPMIKSPLPSPTLTPQQRRCLQLLLQGKTPKAIAKVMHLDAHVTRRHLAALRRKFDCDNNVALVIKAESTVFS